MIYIMYYEVIREYITYNKKSNNYNGFAWTKHLRLILDTPGNTLVGNSSFIYYVLENRFCIYGVKPP